MSLLVSVLSSARPKQLRTSFRPTWGSRSVNSSATPRKALPFSLSLNENVRAGEIARDEGDSDAAESGVLRMLMFGKPGAGKGTLTARLVKNYDILSLSTGDMLRGHIAERTEVGRMAEEVVATGGLLPDEIMLKVVTSKLDLLHNKARHWILDGFPRTLGQGKLLDEHLRQQGTPLSLVVNLDVPESIILGRISDRWVHLPSGRVYNLSYNPPKVAGHDDETGEPLTKRPDDNPETFARRLEKFYASTSPLLSYFRSNRASHLVTLTGATSDEIWPQLDNVVRSSFPGLKERPESRDLKRRSSLSDAYSRGTRGNLTNKIAIQCLAIDVVFLLRLLMSCTHLLLKLLIPSLILSRGLALSFHFLYMRVTNLLYCLLRYTNIKYISAHGCVSDCML
ncbi:adenylate kinase-domain-containing protein [Amylocystis lapponica]|nr:adenylate kinase-domain-containing protein [Amylocystis lapponica]